MVHDARTEMIRITNNKGGHIEVERTIIILISVLDPWQSPYCGASMRLNLKTGEIDYHDWNLV